MFSSKIEIVKVDQSSIVVRAKSQNTHIREIRCIRFRITVNRSIVSSIEIQFVREGLLGKTLGTRSEK